MLCVYYKYWHPLFTCAKGEGGMFQSREGLESSLVDQMKLTSIPYTRWLKLIPCVALNLPSCALCRDTCFNILFTVTSRCFSGSPCAGPAHPPHCCYSVWSDRRARCCARTGVKGATGTSMWTEMWWLVGSSICTIFPQIYSRNTLSCNNMKDAQGNVSLQSLTLVYSFWIQIFSLSG